MASTSRRGKEAESKPRRRKADAKLTPRDFLNEITKTSTMDVPLPPLEEVLQAFYPPGDNRHDHALAIASHVKGATDVKHNGEPDPGPVGLKHTSPNHDFPWWDPRGHMIDQLAEETDDGLPKSFHLAKVLVNQAINGDLNSAKEVMDRVLGKSTQHVEMRSEQHINHYDVSADPVAFDVVVRVDETKDE
jgi:hypothetical protein